MNMSANKIFVIRLLVVITGFLLAFSCHTKMLAQSPYELQWPKERIIFGTGLAAGIAGGVLVIEVEPLTVEEINLLSRDDVNQFDRPAVYNYSESADVISDVVRNICIMLPATLLFSKKIRNDFRTFGAMYLQNLIFASALPMISKGIFKRTRPFVYNENAPLGKKVKTQARLGFFSGHTTNAFAGAVFFATTYNDYFPDSALKPFVWGGSFLLASIVGYSRIEAGKHFRSDVLAGAVVGSAIGYFIPRLHRRKQDSGLSVSPVYKDRQLQVVLNYSF
jgi:membrane-associated phospholipid phosphatase